MLIRSGLVLMFGMSICATAFGEEKYTFHENVKPGQKMSVEVTYQDHEKTATQPKDKPAEESDVQTRRVYKLKLTVLEAKDGSATKARLEVGNGSIDSTKIAGGDETVVPSPFVGKKITVARDADGTTTNDFKGEAEPDELDMLNSLLTPDQDFYPDHPVAVGDTWDASNRFKAHLGLGKEDKFKCVCRLDWVKKIDDKQMAQITYSMATVRHDDEHVESDSEEGGTVTVDVAAGQIVKTEQAGKTKYSTPAGEPTQVTGTSEDSSHTTTKNEKPESSR